MSFFFPNRRDGTAKLQGYVDARGSNSVPGKIRVDSDTALRHSAVWACVRLRADLFSTFPVDAYRKVAGVRTEIPLPSFFSAPGGEHWEWEEWAWASSSDLDRTGNTVGLITERNATGLPNRIELVPISAVTVIWKKGTPMSARKYKIDNKEYDAEQVWHERQFPVSGHAIGLSPVAYAAWSIGEYMNIQDFILQWFSGGGVPKASLRNMEKKLPNDKDALAVKERFKAMIQHGDLFVHGADWEYKPIQAEAMGIEWLEGKRYGLSDVCRFFGCPADVVDATVSAGGSITYANLTERNLQFLIHHLGPMVFRREKKLSKLLAGKPRYIKFNTDALLRMDPKATAETIGLRIDAKTLTPSEARAFYDLPPLTDAQIEEFNKLFPVKMPTPVGAKPQDNPQTKALVEMSLRDRMRTEGVRR